jgi:hypothetical protein
MYNRFFRIEGLKMEISKLASILAPTAYVGIKIGSTASISSLVVTVALTALLSKTVYEKGELLIGTYLKPEDLKEWGYASWQRATTALACYTTPIITLGMMQLAPRFLSIVAPVSIPTPLWPVAIIGIIAFAILERVALQESAQQDPYFRNLKGEAESAWNQTKILLTRVPCNYNPSSSSSTLETQGTIQAIFQTMEQAIQNVILTSHVFGKIPAHRVNLDYTHSLVIQPCDKVIDEYNQVIGTFTHSLSITHHYSRKVIATSQLTVELCKLRDNTSFYFKGTIGPFTPPATVALA